MTPYLLAARGYPAFLQRQSLTADTKPSCRQAYYRRAIR